MISLRQLRYFAAAAQAGSATGAAGVLNVSQPSVSAAIRELEMELGQPLFARKQARGLELTDFGILKLAEARELLARAEALAARPGAAPSRLALGYFSTIGPSWVPGALDRLHRDLPGLRVDPGEYDLESLAKALERGTVDLALTYDIGLPAGIGRELLMEIAPHAVLPPGHPLARGADVSLADLARHPFIQVDLPLSREFLMMPFWQAGLAPQVVLRTGSVEMVRGMVANGLGVAVLFTRPRHDLTHDGKRVVCRPIRDGTIRQRLVLARAAGPAGERQAAAAASIRGFFADMAGRG